MNMKQYTLAEFTRANIERCENNWHPILDWTPSEWAVAFGGEAGETLNAVKKLNRRKMGKARAKDPKSNIDAINAIADEIADTIHYATLLAASLGIDLNAAMVEKFNAVSEETGCKERM